MNYKMVLKANNQSRCFVKLPVDKMVCDADSIRVIPTYFGICGSDLFHYLNNTEDKICFGHEWIGQVSEVGENVKNIKVGNIVTTSSTLGCGVCNECQKSQVNFCLKPVHLGSPVMGALMGELVFNAFNARVLKSEAKSEVLIEVAAVAEEAIRLMKESTSLANKKILVMGAGTVGLLIASLLQRDNFEVQITDPHQSRIERARKLGLKAMPLKHFSLMSEPNSFEILFDATSDRGDEKGGIEFWSKFSSLHHHILVIGKYLKTINVNLNTLAKLGGNIKFMRGVPLSTMDFTIEKWSSRLEEISQILISHEFDISEVQNAFDMALSNDKSGKVIVRINV